jgi:prolyl-tRNA synthetase
MVGAIVMAHGDDVGLRLPPRLAPIQAVIVPIFRNDDEQGPVIEASARLKTALSQAGIRVHMDQREGYRPGFKFNDWEMRGVPLRIEIGPKDVEENAVVLARRDILGKDGKQTVSQEGIAPKVCEVLEAIQAHMLQQATEFRDANIHDVRSYDEFKQVIDKGAWVRGYWAGSDDDERRVKDETGATLRCFPFGTEEDKGSCFMTGRGGGETALFARAY